MSSNKFNDDYAKFIDIYSNTKRDISSSYEDISSHSQPTKTAPSRRKKKRKKRSFLKVVSVLLSVVLIFAIAFYAYAYNLINKMTRDPLDTDNLGIASDTYKGITNIALLGIDTRSDDDTGRSDAIVVLTIDKDHNKLKLTSIARDTYVSVDGYGKDKLTHAYAYGKSQLAVKTLNQNFDLEITDYVTMNFFGLARVIDFIGGVTIDIDDAELQELNSYIIPTTDFGDITCENIAGTGEQLLSGAQAVCYARIRHTDGDIQRGNRQKEVLSAMFAAVKKMNILKLPELATLILEECSTSLSTNDIMGLGIWAVLTSPEFENLSIPNDNVPYSGRTYGGVWYYVYDLDKAKEEIKDFIFEEGYYSPEEVAKRLEEEK